MNSGQAATEAPPAPADIAWYRLNADEVLGMLSSSRRGLSPSESAARLSRIGRNEIADRGGKHPLRILWEQLTAVMVVILIGASLLSLVLGKYLEAGAIGAIVVLFALLGFMQEYRAERAIAALRAMAVPTVRVIRAGRPHAVPAVELVPGDVVQLEAGVIVSADLRLLEVASLRVEEAALTGESVAVDKQVAAIDSDVALGDRRNLAFSGTHVTYGRAVGVVVATGMATELGRIARLLQDVEAEATPLQRRLDRLGKQLAVAGVAVAAAVVAMGAAAGEPASDLALTAISVAVAVVPEGLPAVVTFTLAIGAQRMLRRNALIRKLPAVETLGSVTTICSDKTGTLTQNRMTVTVIDVAGHRQLIDPSDPAAGAHVVRDGPAATGLVLTAAALCNDGDAHVEDGSLVTIGDPTETALLVAAHSAGLDVVGLRAAMPRIAEQPFDSDRKRMSTLHPPIAGRVAPLSAMPQDVPIAFVKGAVDGMLAHATHVWDDDRAVPMTEEWLRRVHAANDELAAHGMRLLGVAFRALEGEPPGDDVERDLTLLGLVAMIDPPRPEVGEAVATCQAAGIRPVMITGDHPLTARAIATDLGIMSGDDALTGAELDRLSETEFDEATGRISVFARVSPEHKLRIVRSLQARGEVVAMTGDGVNDAPALKRADIGVAMGITGTDVSKEAADMVLRDDNFATIVAAVEEGRVIYDNLRRFVSFAVGGNIGKILVMLGWPIPLLIAGGQVDDAVALLPLQLLWLNLMTDGLLGLSMGVEPAERSVMRRPPQTPTDSLWSRGMGSRTAWIGTFIGVAALAVGIIYHEVGAAQWQSMMFTSLAFLQVAQAFGTRSSVESLRSMGWASNRLLVWIAALVVGLQLAALYTPLRDFLDLEPLGPTDLALCGGLAVALLGTIEAVKARQGRTVKRAGVEARG